MNHLEIACEAIPLAKRHLNNGTSLASSALVCYHNAIDAFRAKQDDRAAQWAFKSLAYSVGIFHPDCEKVGRAIGHKFFIASKPTHDPNPCVDTSCLNK